MRESMAPFISSGNKDYDTNLQSMAWARRVKDKNGKIFYSVKFSANFVYHIHNNDFYEESIKKFSTMWDDNVVVTKEVKDFRKHYKSITQIPRYQVWKVGTEGGYTKVSFLSAKEDKNGKPYYFIPKTKVIPFRTNMKYALKKNYYIFHQDINKNGTLKNKARLWFPVKPWAFRP